jgi:hypothetical protein
MHPFLTKLGVPPAVQDFFEPYYTTDETGNLVFWYGEEAEHFGFAFHRIPADGLWTSGNPNLSMIRHVFICDSAMEAISYFSLNHHAFRQIRQCLFIAGSIDSGFCGKSCTMVFNKDILGRVRDLMVAAAIRKLHLTISLTDDQVHARFRQKNYSIPQEQFSLSAFEKISKYRFNIKAQKPKTTDCWLDQLKTSAFNY